MDRKVVYQGSKYRAEIRSRVKCPTQANNRVEWATLKLCCNADFRAPENDSRSYSGIVRLKCCRPLT
jgi:hypothetical protein